MTEPVWQPATQQNLFRQVLNVMAQPGTLGDLSAQLGKTSAAMGILATLSDGTISLADPHHLIRNSDWRFLEAKAASPDSASYIICDGQLVPNFNPRLGSLESPELGATLVLVVEALGRGELELTLSGPGVEGQRTLLCTGLNLDWIKAREKWNAAFPMGVDLILTDPTRVVAIPRTTRIACHEVSVPAAILTN